MGRRDTLISRSILDAIFQDRHSEDSSFLSRVFGFFTLFNIALSRYERELFKSLRVRDWEFDEDEYRESFRSADKKGKLNPVGDLGYSGSVCLAFANINLTTHSRRLTFCTSLDLLHYAQLKVSNKVSSSPI